MRVDLQEYWSAEPPHEGLVLSLQVDHGVKALTVIYDYAAESVSRHFSGLPPTGVRDFRRVCLKGVSGLSVTSFRNTDTADSLRMLHEQALSAGIVVIRYQLDKCNGSDHLELELSHGFDVQLHYSDVDAESRLLRSTQVGERQWLYHDVKTGAEVDFYRPFDTGLGDQQWSDYL